MASFEKLESTFSPNVQVRGKQFEKLLKWWLQTDPVYSARLKKVWLWDEWPGRDGADIGIDLVAEAHDGGIWAIQAKCIDPKNSLRKSEVDSFLAASSKSPFTFQLLITSTGNLSANLLRAFSGRPSALVTRAELASSEVDWPASINHLATGKRKKPRTPRKHQKAAIADVLGGFEISKRGQLIMACGTGKTLTALFIAKETEAKRILVLLPSLSLLSQTLREWASSDFKFEFLPVCSDETVSTPDAALGSVSELGFPVTTSPEEIATFLKRRSGNRVVFATYQSSPRIAAAFAGGGIPKFDLVIADEAHRCAGRVSSDYGTVLDEDLIPSKKLLFMTATPRYFTGRVIKEAKESDFEVASMDDHQVFGPVFHTLSFSDAIDKKLLTDYQVVIVGVDDDTYLEWVNEGQFVTIDGTKVTDARSLAAQIGLLKAMKRFDLRRIISFHSRVKKAKEFASSMPEVLAWMPKSQRPKGTLISDFVSGEMPTGSRKVKLDRLATIEPSERALLANARCLTEGVDVPALDGVAFVDPRSSEVDIVQAVGRAIRLADDKKIGTIVLPIFIPTNRDSSTALSDPAFTGIWKVLEALRSHDSKLGESLDELRREMGSGSRVAEFPQRILLDLPERVGPSFTQAIQAKIVENTTSSWEFHFGVLQSFVQREGHARVPQGQVESGVNVGSWVATQRSMYRSQNLASTRVVRLEALPLWSWNPYDDDWEQGLSLILEFVDREGHAQVPAQYRQAEFALGRWVSKRRTEFRTGRLAVDRAARLEEIRGWTWTPHGDQWERALSSFKEYVDREGNARIPRGHLESGINLRTWVMSQRTEHRKGQLSPDRVQRLEAEPSWSWDAREDRWENMFSLLVGFVNREGTAQVPQDHIEGGFNLGGWVSNRRAEGRSGRLSIDRVKRLEALSGWTWHQVDLRWQHSYLCLKAFIEVNGNAQVPKDYVVENVQLGSWVSNQRGKYRSGQLPVERVQLLDSLPGWTWKSQTDQWGHAFEILKTFVVREGHADVAQNQVEDGFDLGRWVSKQRGKFRSGGLSGIQVQLLESLPGWTWNSLESRWEEAFASLQTFVAREGNCRVPKSHFENGFNLGSWVQIQRLRFQKQLVPEDRVKRLESVPGWVWDQIDARWEESYSKLLDFVSREGHSRVPAKHREGSFKIGIWCDNQRAKFRAGTLSNDRISRLEELSGWSWNPLDDLWDEKFSVLARILENEGDDRIPRSRVEGGINVGSWVDSRRAEYRAGTLPADRIARLESLRGWSWDPHSDLWENGFLWLSNYVKREGNALVPAKHLEGDFTLGAWVNSQRSKYRQGKISSDRVQRLEAIPGWLWSVRGES
jgi:superfamily II DNA or RNA helicase